VVLDLEADDTQLRAALEDRAGPDALPLPKT